MSANKRRDVLKASATLATGAVVGPFIWVKQAAAQWRNEPEKAAKLRVLRWKRFVQGDEDQYTANVKKFTETFGIEVRVDHEGWEDVRPKAAVAGNTGAGPDIILSTNDDADLYPDKLVAVTDLCDYLGQKHGGWYPVCEQSSHPLPSTACAPPLAPISRSTSAASSAGWRHFLQTFRTRRCASTPSNEDASR